MRLIVCPRWRVKELDLDVRHAIVSISDPAPWGKPADLPKQWGQIEIGRWAFLDCDPQQADHYDGLMTLDQACEIWDFLDRMIEQGAEAIVVHCEAGASRSPSVAMAIADCMGLGRESVTWRGVQCDDKFAPPNDYVYGLMCEATLPRKVRQDATV
jgi:predicted protein tyrosine phosphatase